MAAIGSGEDDAALAVHQAQAVGGGHPRGPAVRDAWPIITLPLPSVAGIAVYLPVLQLYVECQLEDRAHRPPRVHRARILRTPSPDHICVATYRLDPGGVQELCELLGPTLHNHVQSDRCIPVVQRVLMCLHYLAKGCFQGDVARLHNTSQSSASRCVSAVVDALVSHIGTYIKFPLTQQEMDVARAHFYAIAGFPNVIGAVDGTHICISRPPHGGAEYLNRHHQMSLNVMATADAQGYFTSVFATEPGSFHDARVFRTSALHDIAASWPDGSAWLLGDRGYPLQPYLLTPYPHDTPGAIARYNAAHRRTRIVVERAFGMLKMRFRCLHLTGGRLLRIPAQASQVIGACMILHNICLQRRIPLLDDEGEVPEYMPLAPDAEDIAQHHPGQHPRGVELRTYVATKYFGMEPVVSHTQGRDVCMGSCVPMVGTASP